MAERPTKEIVKKKLAKEVTQDLIGVKMKRITNGSLKKYSKLIVWDGEMKDVIEFEAKKRGMTTTSLIKYCVAKELIK